MGLRTPLYDWHAAHGAKMVDFGGWDMPLHYGSQLEEHHQVRRDAGLFDVSHMTVVDFHGAEAGRFLQTLLANDVARIQQTPGKALYSCMLNETGGVVDDLIVYFIRPDCYRMVVNAATTEKDLAWIESQRAHYAPSVDMRRRDDLAMLAVQGPQARAKTTVVLGEPAVDALKPFTGGFFKIDGAEYFVARTGYTGEDGFEIMLPNTAAPGLARRLLDAGVRPAGLGARDTLRLEAGMNLYGQDMDEGTTPLESNLAWTVALKDSRDFIGRAALETQQRAGVPRSLVGLVIPAGGIPRAHQAVLDAEGKQIGEITSGSFSPTLGLGIAFARVQGAFAPGDALAVEIRGKAVPAQVVRPPFVKQGQRNF
ncbi:glycine cleavage system aminomethyltransferase GcvT [Thermithiobacillus tepidarius DSM 3134]|uniref:glycine cleavage system aminomethyltransferase GcvT n=1 Tax=Thermithiobacillus tepidarius TaxID=929 RepID=UPI0003FF9AF3|nr:glycine cleavage system aminomethyltransferase GcvT [Thermithiobacillus tepidarius]